MAEGLTLWVAHGGDGVHRGLWGHRPHFPRPVGEVDTRSFEVLARLAGSQAIRIRFSVATYKAQGQATHRLWLLEPGLSGIRKQ